MTDFPNDFPCEKQVCEHFFLDFWRLYIGEGGSGGGVGGFGGRGVGTTVTCKK